MPLDPDLPLVPEAAEDMDELELEYHAMLATVINFCFHMHITKTI